MALIKCPECSAEISSKADKCPHCQKDVIFEGHISTSVKIIVRILYIVISLFIAVIACSSLKNNSAKNFYIQGVIGILLGFLARYMQNKHGWSLFEMETVDKSAKIFGKNRARARLFNEFFYILFIILGIICLLFGVSK